MNVNEREEYAIKNEGKVYRILFGIILVVLVGYWFITTKNVSSTTSYETKLVMLEEAANKYGEDNKELLKNNPIYISVTDLMNYGYLESEYSTEKIIINPVTKTYFNGNMKIYINSASGSINSYYTDEPLAYIETAIQLEVSNITSNSFVIEAVLENSEYYRYMFNIDNKGYTKMQRSNKYTAEDLTMGTHQVKIAVVDENDEIMYAQKSVVTLDIEKPTYKLSGESIIIKFPENNGNYKYQYRTNAKGWKTIEDNQVTISARDIEYVIARVYDNYNYITGNKYVINYTNGKLTSKEISIYDVSFDINGGTGSSSSQMVEVNGLVNKPADPTKKGYSFVGWYVGSSLYDFNTKVDSSLVLRARWKANVYTVSFDINGGTGNYKTQNVEFNGLVTKPLTIPTRPDYIFNGWYLGDVEYDFSSFVTNHMILTAHWKGQLAVASNLHKVTFDLNGGKGVIDVQVVEKDDNAIKPANPVREGYLFSGWYLNDQRYVFSSKITKDITLVAKWKSIPTTKYFVVSYDLTGGSGNVSSSYIASGSVVEKPLDPVKRGYTFNGWYNNGNLFDFSTKVTDNITLTANWTKNH